ncbi:MAG: hypothetical protein J6K39_00215 [Clostridia bacterium]|nr:hypothetical protein [Clostridia bacterium]
MFKSLLNATNVSIDSLILDIFIILGVVIAGALIVYFLWEAVSAIMNKSKKSEASIKEPNFGEKKKEKQEDVLVVDYELDAAPVKEEAQEELLDETKLEEVDEAKAEEEKTELADEQSEEERENAARRAALEARRQELIRRMQAEMEEESTEEVETTDEAEETEEVAEEPAQEAEAIAEEETADEAEEEVAAEEVEETVEEDQVDALEEEREALAAEKARYETMVRELEAAKQALAAQQEIVAVPAPVVTNGVLSLEELKERLAATEEKLKATEKEFKQCKKEYMPLHKVWVAHEKDERKLRRKEALVAKQKVLLYGVNNYADIDEEKAKKLAEDLGLLDGLKLSVQHCEEVMKKNEERYPLLERMYKVLAARNEELKKDIAYYKEEIAKLEAPETEESAEENE